MAAQDATAQGLVRAAAALAGCRYLLAMPVPWHRGADGAVWIDALWHRDLMRHLDYLDDLTVLAPCLPLGDAGGLVRVDPARTGLRFMALPGAGSVGQAVLRAPATLATVLRAVRGADLVHSGVAGWPLPPGLFVNPVAVLLRRPLVIVVESAFWRLTGAGPHSRKARIRAAITEAFARWSVRRASLSVFTQDDYRATLARGSESRALVTPATWIDADDVLDPAAAVAAWRAKTGPVRLLLAARLIPEKGIPVLLDALRLPGAADLAVRVDIIGDGALRPAVAEAAASIPHLRLLDPVPYGAPFLALLRTYHAVLVPSVSDEQPRILFDAASQAVPVLASDTAGHRGWVDEGVTGWRFAPGDTGALLAMLQRAENGADVLRQMGLAGRDRVPGWTHQAMHLVRAERLALLCRKTRPG